MPDELKADCGYFAKRGVKTQPLDEWKAVHVPHMSRDLPGVSFATEPLANAPEGYPAYWLICGCGARILTKSEDE